MIKKFGRNDFGKDYVVGDIHGMFHILQAELNAIGFDEETDRLFSVGDLVDRGPDSEAALDWLNKPFLFAVRGNHEEFVLTSNKDDHMAGVHAANGGIWFHTMPTDQQNEFIIAFAELPLAIEVEVAGGRVGIVHAEVPLKDWNFMQTLYNTNQDYFESIILWSRNIISSYQRGDIIQNVEGIDRVYVGHTPVKNPVNVGNIRYIDTGAVFGRNLTIEELRLD